MEFVISVVVLRGVGLFLNMVGAALIWAFGLPPRQDADTRAYLAGIEHDEASIRKERIRDIAATLGIAILIFGFLLQFIANYAEAPLYFDLSFRPNI